MNLVASLFLLAQVSIPVLRERVTDTAGVLSPADAAALDQRLRALEQSDGTQVVLLIVPTIGDKPIEEFALEVGRKSEIGQKEHNNGIVILIAVNDKKCRIEVGHGLEGKLPDGLCGSIIRNEMVPHFKKGDYSSGARAGTQAVIQAVKGEYRAKASGKGEAPPIWFLGPVIVFLIICFTLKRLHRGYGWSSWGYTSGYSGGSSSSGFSGFSGGGGSFGGGGASGSW